MITHATQITFNDVISVETQQEYDECLEVIRKQGGKIWLGAEFDERLKCCIAYLPTIGLVSGAVIFEGDRITPASYFIEANRGLLNDKK